MKIDFDNEAVFLQLEEDAIDGALDYDSFPPEEYRYFSQLSRLGYMNRHKGWSVEICEEKKADYKKRYISAKDQSRRFLDMSARMHDNIRRSGTLRSEINKAETYDEKLRLALEAIELMTGEEGFAKRNLDLLYPAPKIKNYNEFRNERDMIDGALNRICVSKDVDEVLRHTRYVFWELGRIYRYKVDEIAKNKEDQQ